VTDSKTMGAYLRAARRGRRISIERAAEETKIRSDFLMRMESDEFDFLAPAYVRGFLKSYARYLHVDPEPLIEDFDRRYGGRVDTAEIIAQQRRSRRRRKGMKEPRKVNSWVVAAVFAAGILVFLAIVGLAQDDPSEPARDRRVATREESPEPKETARPTPTPTATPTPTPTPSPSPTDILATAEGIELKIVASTGDCWVDVTSDGVNTYSETIPHGETQAFTADNEMSIVLGLPQSVELIVNGHNLGSPGGVDPITIQLPDDVDTL
jgi:cytoskeleton protein RodZ